MAVVDRELDKWLYVQLPARPKDFESSSPIFKEESSWEHYTCLLCNQDQILPRNQIVTHCRFDNNHIARMTALIDRQTSSRAALELARSKYTSLKPTIQGLGSTKWQAIIRSEMCLQLTSIIATGGTSKDSKWEIQEALVDKFEKMEQLSLLELAIWKAACIMEKTEELTYYEMLEWKSRGWKESKSKMRRSNAIDVIIQNTMPFLYA
jgi:hypothetical protein